MHNFQRKLFKNICILRIFKHYNFVIEIVLLPTRIQCSKFIIKFPVKSRVNYANTSEWYNIEHNS